MIKKIISNKVFNISIFYILLLVLTVALCFHNPSIDVDIWSRLIMGNYIHHTGSVMYHDIISYAPTHVWYDHEWLLSYLIYVLVKYFGVGGIFFLKILLSFMTIVFIDLVIVQKCDTFEYKYKYLYITLLIALMAHTVVFSTLRCQNLTYAFLPILILLLERYKNNANSVAIYFIPPLILLWLNCHGGCMYGLGIMGLYVLGQICNRKKFIKLSIILIISMLMFFINPWGADFVKFMIDAISVNRAYIAEWQSPFTMSSGFLIPFCVIQITILAVYMYSSVRQKLNFKTIDYVKLFVFIATFIIGLKYIKYAIVYFMILFTYLYDDFKIVCDDILKLAGKFIKKCYITMKQIAFSLYVLTAIILFSTCNFNLYYINTIKELPLYQLQFLIDNNIKGKIFMSFFTSGYAAYKCYPNLKIYIDGRQEQVYDESVVAGEINFLFQPENYGIEFLNKHRPDIILIETFFGVANFLDRNQNYYKKVLQDDRFVLYFAPNVQLSEYKYPERVPDFSQRNFMKSNYFN